MTNTSLTEQKEGKYWPKYAGKLLHFTVNDNKNSYSSRVSPHQEGLKSA
jgi:hypothetical protein